MRSDHIAAILFVICVICYLCLCVRVCVCTCMYLSLWLCASKCVCVGFIYVYCTGVSVGHIITFHYCRPTFCSTAGLQFDFLVIFPPHPEQVSVCDISISEYMWSQCPLEAQWRPCSVGILSLQVCQ